MTVFVVSLFLPYTIHFDVRKPAARPDPPLQHILTTEDLSLFALRLGNSASTQATPAISTEHEQFFLSQKPSSFQSYSPHLPQLKDLPATTPSETLTPLWGQGLFVQPKSRAEDLPPVSILKYAAEHDRTTRSRVSSIPDIRQDSHERALQTADWSVQPGDQGNAGVRNAINAASRTGALKEKTWVGTLGMPTDALEDTRKFDIEDKLENEYDSLPIFTSDNDFDGHYSHYCKTILWPVFHYQIPDNPKSKAYEDHSWVYYVKINQAFADRIVKHWKRGDVIWIHDYHLLLVPGMIRKKIPDAQIGFFLHTAFPSSEVFRCLAMRKELLEGLLGANLLGFQTKEYCNHFLQTCNRLLCAEATADGVQLEDRFVNVAEFPAGVDLETLDTRRRDPEVGDWIKRMRSKYANKQLIVARDKLDHVRGVRQKLLAYELFLNKNPHLKEKVVLIQVASSTTEQVELEATVSDIVTRINSIHSTLAHQPIVFLKQDIEYSQYLAMITVADVMMITSLREGMGLTSHEYIYCQDGKCSDKHHGPLILSEFTGSSSLFEGYDLPVNPWDYRQCADAIKTAIEMSASERERRWLKLMDIVVHHTAEFWVTSFLEKLSKVHNEHSMRDTLSIPRLSVHELADKYKNAKQRLFILDYEGTLAAYGTSTSIVFTSPQRTLDVLNNLLYDEKNIVYVMSSRKPEEMDRLFRRVPKIGLIAENGCFLKEYDTENWIDMANVEKSMTWKQSVLMILDYYKDRTEGSWIEERHCSLVFHYADAKDPAGAIRQAGDCANHINDSCQGQQVHAVIVDGELLIESTEWTKGTAAARIFEGLKHHRQSLGLEAPEFLMVAGNAREDEIIYRWANTLAKDGVIRDVTTVSVSSRNTEAMATLTQGVNGVLSALQKLATLS
ncbi:hypothetical protein MMC34_006303 [Xylographa carneopallida]|nr:hypothetical protein [Xylographa carneopallida]